MLGRRVRSDALYLKIAIDQCAVAYVIRKSFRLRRRYGRAESILTSYMAQNSDLLRSDDSQSRKTLNPPPRCCDAASEIARDTAAAWRNGECRQGAWRPRRLTAPNSDNRPSLATPSRLWVK
jgi:hypothetical protein